MYHTRATFKEALKQVIYIFQNKAKIMGKRAKGGRFQVSSYKTLHIFVPFVCILCSWI